MGLERKVGPSYGIVFIGGLRRASCIKAVTFKGEMNLSTTEARCLGVNMISLLLLLLNPPCTNVLLCDAVLASKRGPLTSVFRVAGAA